VTRRDLICNELFEELTIGWAGLLLKKGKSVFLQGIRMRLCVLLWSRHRYFCISDAAQELSEPWTVLRAKLDVNLDRHFRITSATVGGPLTVNQKVVTVATVG
jgi:hypothetical protein